MARSTPARQAVRDLIGAADEDKIRAEAERQTGAARAEVRQLKRMVEIERERADHAEERLDIALAIQEPRKPPKIQSPARKPNEAAAVLVASDWHVGELVDQRTVAGRNHYTPDIARKRAERFFANGCRLIELSRAGVKVETAVLAVLGDIITGYIHDELEESNQLSPTEEVLFAQELLTAGIHYLLDKAKLKRLIVPCCFGNHGRTTKKRRISTGSRNSFEWLLYRTMQKQFSGEERVEFVVGDGAHLYLEVYGTRVRFTHGDDIRYQGGVGGLTIPMRKAIDSWDRFEDSDLTVCGHWHQLLYGTDFVVNGSLIGYGPYALSIKARYEPPQQAFFLLDRDYGRTIHAPIRVE
jgi:hypothetical protein